MATERTSDGPAQPHQEVSRDVDSHGGTPHDRGDDANASPGQGPAHGEMPDSHAQSRNADAAMQEIEVWSGLSAPSEAPEVVRQMTVRVLTERIKLLGINKSGAYEHYSVLLTKGFPIPPYEIAILDLVRSRFPNLRSYHEIGSGLGTLPLMLAHDGFASVGVEQDERRHLTATTILRQLSADLPHIETNCRLLGASFPGAVADLDVSESMAILTDVVSSPSEAEYVRVCRGLRQYRYVLLDLQRFFYKRTEPEDHDRLIRELATYGLVARPEVIDLDSEGYYRVFENRTPRTRITDIVAEEARKAGVVEGESPVPAATEERPAQMPVAMPRGDLATLPGDRLPEAVVVDAPPSISGVVLPPLPRRAPRRRFGGLLGLSALLVIGLPTLLAIAYYGFLASAQYVTTFQFAVRGPSQLAAARPSAPSSALGSATAMTPDAFVVTDYINSPQAIADVQRNMNVRAVFSAPDIDYFSRLAANADPETMQAYWKKVVWAHFDLISGNISVSVRAFTPQESFKLAEALVASSDEMFRQLNTQAQRDFVKIADDNLGRAQQQLAAAREAVLAFREQSGLVDPDKTAQAGSAIIDDLRKQLAGFQAQYASVQAASPKSPLLSGLSSQISALEAQIRKEDPLGSSAVKAVSAETLRRYQSLDLERQFAEKQYTEALSLRNEAYVTAQKQQSYLALFVAPSLPQTSLYPDRLGAIATVFLAAAVAWFIGMLVTYAVRDHLL